MSQDFQIQNGLSGQKAKNLQVDDIKKPMTQQQAIRSRKFLLDRLNQNLYSNSNTNSKMMGPGSQEEQEARDIITSGSKNIIIDDNDNIPDYIENSKFKP